MGVSHFFSTSHHTWRGSSAKPRRGQEVRGSRKEVHGRSSRCSRTAAGGKSLKAAAAGGISLKAAAAAKSGPVEEASGPTMERLGSRRQTCKKQHAESRRWLQQRLSQCWKLSWPRWARTLFSRRRGQHCRKRWANSANWRWTTAAQPKSCTRRKRGSPERQSA